MNYITLKQFAELSNQLKLNVTILESKLEACGIKIQKSQPTGFRNKNRNRCILELYR